MRGYQADSSRYWSSRGSVGKGLFRILLLKKERHLRIMDFDAEIKSPRPGVNDEMIVSLLRTNLEIQTYFKHTGHLLPNQGLFIH